MPKNKNLPSGQSRRSFLKKTIVGGIAAATFPSMTFGNNSFLTSADIKRGEFDEITVDELINGMKSGKYTAHYSAAAFYGAVMSAGIGRTSLSSISRSSLSTFSVEK